jgi:2-oxoglutarate ferredoxin oxidoreductase subunit beta
MPDILKRAYQHKGASFVEIFQNCIVYNDAVFDEFAGKKAAPDALLWVENGKPLVYANGTKGLRLNRERVALEVVPIEDGKTDGLDILVHDETNKTVAQLLLDMPFGAFPVAMGVLYCNPAPTLEGAVVEQRSKAVGRKRDLNALLSKGETWTVGPTASAS